VYKRQDKEVIKGLQLVAASINSELAKRIFDFRLQLEYTNCHRKEIAVYRWLDQQSFSCIPPFFGALIDEKKETFLVCIGDLSNDSSIVLDTENKAHLWTFEAVKKVIQSISSIHRTARNEPIEFSEVQQFHALESLPLYQQLATICEHEHGNYLNENFGQLWEEFKVSKAPESLWKTLIHNDFNPRNVALRTIENEYESIIYDWELAVIHYPHRDMVEFLAFIADQYSDDQLIYFLLLFEKQAACNTISKSDWWKGYHHTLLEFIFTRMTFYVVAHVVIETKFAHRVLNNAMRLLSLIELEINQL
jgi:hydroxymethylglutaryl-CoA reductase (NADPH)